MTDRRKARPHGSGKRDPNQPWWMDPDAKAFLARAARDLPHLVGDSSVSISIVADEVDPKFAVELGYMIMMNKPIVLVVPNGRTVPDKLALVADKIVEWRDDEQEMKKAIITALEELDATVDGTVEK